RRPEGSSWVRRSFQLATIIYEATATFGHRFGGERERRLDGMLQTAAAGRLRMVELGRMGRPSDPAALALMRDVPMGLGELLRDFVELLRERNLEHWGKEDARVQAVRNVGREPGSRQPSPPDAANYRTWLESGDPSVVANALICLIYQSAYLLDLHFGR